jgi:hypothetical protein
VYRLSRGSRARLVRALRQQDFVVAAAWPQGGAGARHRVRRHRHTGNPNVHSIPRPLRKPRCSMPATALRRLLVGLWVGRRSGAPPPKSHGRASVATATGPLVRAAPEIAWTGLRGTATGPLVCRPGAHHGRAYRVEPVKTRQGAAAAPRRCTACARPIGPSTGADEAILCSETTASPPRWGVPPSESKPVRPGECFYLSRRCGPHRPVRPARAIAQVHEHGAPGLEQRGKLTEGPRSPRRGHVHPDRVQHDEVKR